MSSTANHRTAGGALTPVTGRERVVALDALRGFAILGILLVNVEIFRGPEGFFFSMDGLDLSTPDDLLGFLISFLAEGKFISSLALMFGLGFAFQSARAEAKGYSSARLLARRMLVLALFGVAHAILIWSGDILLTYALLGFLFLPFRNRRSKTLVIWASMIIGIPLLLALAVSALTLLAYVMVGPEQMTAGSSEPVFFQELAVSAQEAYTSGSYTEMVAQRLRELVLILPLLLLLYSPSVFAMMLLGAAVSRAGWLDDLSAHRGSIRRSAIIGLSVGLPLNFLYALSETLGPDNPLVLLGLIAYLPGFPLLAIGYMSLATLLFTRYPLSAATRRLAAVGRMALTNYLMQSVIMTAIFYGLALYGNLGLAPSLLICAAVYVLQLTLSPIYLSRFSYGPVEWLWRQLTYGRRAKMMA